MLKLKLEQAPTTTFAGKMTMFSEDKNKITEAIALLPQGSQNSDFKDKTSTSIGFYANKSRLDDMKNIVNAKNTNLGSLDEFMGVISEIENKYNHVLS